MSPVHLISLITCTYPSGSDFETNSGRTDISLKRKNQHDAEVCRLTGCIQIEKSEILRKLQQLDTAYFLKSHAPQTQRYDNKVQTLESQIQKHKDNIVFLSTEIEKLHAEMSQMDQN